MTVPVNNVGMSHIQTEYGGSSPISLTEYYRGDQYVPINQLKSIHTDKQIPLVSGGRTQEISIGMFRGTAKKFIYAFTIYEQYTQFHLYDRLVEVGWNEQVPVEVTVTVATSAHVVADHTGNYAINAGSTFPSGSSMVLINNGFILGRGGRGGNTGIYGISAPTPGQDGGGAISINLPTRITNNGVISGGGGGGGATTTWSGPNIISAGGEQWVFAEWVYRGVAGGGGAPFGAAGDIVAGWPSATLAQSGAGRSLFETNSASAAVKTAVGSGGSTPVNYMVGSHFPALFDFASNGVLRGANGGQWGDSGEPGHNYGGYQEGGPDGLTGIFPCLQGTPSSGGLPGPPVTGGEQITWERYGTVRGRLQFPFGYFYNGTTNVIDYFTPNDRNYNKGVSVTRINGPRGYQSLNTVPPNNTYNFWPSGVTYFSYAANTNANNVGSNSNYGADLQPRRITYAAIFELTADDTPMFLQGIVDDRIKFVSINDSIKNILPIEFNMSSINQKTAQFNLGKGRYCIKVQIDDDNGRKYTPTGNAHMFNLKLLSSPNQANIVFEDQWYVYNVENI